jgi:catechol 2,3-dioxygenase-like lactoylglutathione lyase family enzyme
MINKVGANVLFVEDLDKCAAFYRDILGLEVVFTDENSVAYRMDKQDFLLLKDSAAVEMLGEGYVSRDHKSGQHILLCADVENVDTVYHALMAKGVAFIHAPQDQPWGIRAAYFADPGGHLWEIRQILRKA